MKMKHSAYLLPVIFLGLLISCKKEDDFDANKLTIRFQKHISILASDEFEGRETGQPGEKKAAEYLVNEFSNVGLTPGGKDGQYTQSFEFLAGKSFDGENEISQEGVSLSMEKDYFPMNFSASGQVEGKLISVGFGIVSPDHDLDEYAGKDMNGAIALMDVSSPDGIHPHSKYSAYHDLRERCNLAKEMGAIGVVLVNPGEMAEDPKKNYSRKMTPVDIPVVFVNDNSKLKEGEQTSLEVSIQDKFNEGTNVIGLIDNGSERTVIIGAHFDHLGYGDNGSLYRGEEAEIHNGADDNASGTAMIVELANYFARNPIKSNLVIIGFSGEEKGLLGSNHFAKNPTIDLKKANYMINLDMIGRMDSSNSLIVTGVGTSPSWDTLVDGSISTGLKIEEKPDGVGPSDHTSFYLKDIPVLHLFTGAHPDYHKPSDDEELINYQGMVRIFEYLKDLVVVLEGNPKLEFTKTKDSDNEKAPRFSVTLGVVPDYAFSGKGMRIDGVSEGKPASKAGMIAGDVVVKMGELDVVDMMAYMNALSQFKKGDSTQVVVKRGEEELEFGVRF